VSVVVGEQAHQADLYQDEEKKSLILVQKTLDFGYQHGWQGSGSDPNVFGPAHSIQKKVAAYLPPEGRFYIWKTDLKQKNRTPKTHTVYSTSLRKLEQMPLTAGIRRSLLQSGFRFL
jgi:hypothetical protein